MTQESLNERAVVLIRRGKYITIALRQAFHPCVPVPETPPLSVVMLRVARHSSFSAAFSVGKCPRFLVTFRS